jgi:hypothetical protein
MLDAEHCRGMRRDGTYCHEMVDHRVGDVTPDGVIHWTDRPMRWPGLVRFLKMVAISRDPTLAKEVPWRRVYRLNMALKGIEKEAHTRIPARHLRADRVFVRASVAPLSNDVPMRKEAFDWSRREAGKTWD